MASDRDADAGFDEEELADGFDEEIGEEDLAEAEVDDDEVIADDDELVVGIEVELGTDDESVVEDEDEPVATEVAPDEDDLVDDTDVELALDEVLAETIMRTSISEDDDETTADIDPTLDPAETILPKQDDEFRCSSCRLLKKTSQLADPAKMLCRDCV
jgi:hypothetical protein